MLVADFFSLVLKMENKSRKINKKIDVMMVATNAAAFSHVTHAPPRNAYPLSHDPHKTPVYPTSHPCGKHATSFKHGRYCNAI